MKKQSINFTDHNWQILSLFKGLGIVNVSNMETWIKSLQIVTHFTQLVLVWQTLEHSRTFIVTI